MNSRRRSFGLILSVAGVYAYFLLFAQFAFLERVKAVMGEGDALKATLSLMVLGGVGAGFLASRRGRPGQWLTYALLLAAAVAGMAARDLPAWSFPILSLLAGAATGAATVALAGGLGGMSDRRSGCMLVGWGTGAAYAFCNIPWVFTALPGTQCLISAAVALAALLGVRLIGEGEECRGEAVIPWRAMLAFGALVWLDAAAFYVIQHSAEMKAATWRNDMLWRNAAIHLATAVIAGWWLSKGGLRGVWLLAWGALALAGWEVNFEIGREWAGWLYPAGVSLYSTALVAWPGLLAGESPGIRRNPAMIRAAWLFGISGWMASGMGIGMVESLHRVPGAFILIAGAVVAIAALMRRMDLRSIGLAAVVITTAFFATPTSSPPSSAMERGHALYLSEGCIHCHSRYVRPDSSDELLWGKGADTASIMSEQPVLIGNRRQGPDLLHVGGRRSANWMREHFRNPQAFSPDSTMPAYSHLVSDGRAEDLITWLRADAVADTAEVWERSLAWKPSEIRAGDSERGRRLFSASCTACHGAGGLGDGPLAPLMQTPPRNLVAGPFGLSAATSKEPVEVSVMRIVRFGVPGTDMPGHETWPEQELADIAAWVTTLRNQQTGLIPETPR